jgi:hypothetical protein
MSIEEEMTINDRRKYLRRMKRRYDEATRPERGQLLTEMMQVTDLARKTLIRLLAGNLERKQRRRQRGRSYGAALDDALRVIDETLDHICAERLTPQLVTTARQLAEHDELTLTPTLLEQLERISVSTVRRRLKYLRQDEPQLAPRSRTTSNTWRTQVPMRRIPWDQPDPGHFEVDLVHHGGPSAAGEYVHTLQLIDVNTGWSERQALLGRSYRVMADAFQRCLQRLPLPIHELHPDNGSEFFNHHLGRFFAQKLPHTQFSRSRPYHKNDNRFVEQKNASLVRAYLGDIRLDTVAQTMALNHLYEKMWLYYNCFQPVMRLQHKHTITNAQGVISIKRVFDQARPPLDRLCESQAISAADRDRLLLLRDQTNPRQLRQEIYDLLDDLFDLPGATSGATENIFETLSLYSQEGEDELPVTFSFDRTVALR